MKIQIYGHYYCIFSFRYLNQTYGVGLEYRIMPQIRTITKTCFAIIQDVSYIFKQFLMH